MIAIGAYGNTVAYGIVHYNADTVKDLQAFNPANEVMGTTAFVIENSKYYMLTGKKTWKEINPYGAGSGGSVPGEEIIYEGGGV